MTIPIGVVTDEISIDPAISLPLARKMGFAHIELNKIGKKHVNELNRKDLTELRHIIESYGLNVVAVDPPAFKSIEIDKIPEKEITRCPTVVEHLEQIRRSCEVARELGASIVRIFSFRRSNIVGTGNPSPREPKGGPIPEELMPRIIIALRAAADIAADYQITLGLENVRSCWANTGYNTAQILEAASHEQLLSIWDPGNDFVSGGKPYPDGYKAILPFLMHIHVKDAEIIDHRTGLTRWSCIGRGAIDYIGQLSALTTDGYKGVITVETHWRKPGDTGAQSTQETLKGLLHCSE